MAVFETLHGHNGYPSLQPEKIQLLQHEQEGVCVQHLDSYSKSSIDPIDPMYTITL